MKLFLVRHGDIVDPATYSTPLTDLGVQQSRALADRLIYFHGNIYTSPYARTRETAGIIGRRLGIIPKPVPDLGEVRPNETVLDAQGRAMHFLDIVKQLGKDMIFVTHGGIILGLGLAYGHPDGVCDRGQMIEVSV